MELRRAGHEIITVMEEVQNQFRGDREMRAVFFAGVGKE